MVRSFKWINLITLLLSVALLIIVCQSVSGQGTVYNYFYRVSFRDKGNYKVSDFTPSQLFSQRAVSRRLKAGLVSLEMSDLPVNTTYTDQIKALGFTLHCTSRWMNTALFRTQNPADTAAVSHLSFVSGIRVVKKPGIKGSFGEKLDFKTDITETPPYDRPLTMINGYPLHSSGFDGSGIIIAVLDGGFLLADRISSVEHVRARNGILATKDIVAGGNYVYDYHNHGTAVLSVLAGDLPFQIAGTAPGASFFLVRTEDVSTEFPVEEDFWAAGAEYADSAGADVISSSLGYFNFDDPSMNYKFSDMDGNTTFVTRAADMAATKGILVVASAGNERNKTWKRIIAPSDGNNVMCTGAVDGNNLISVFSSAGPSADGRVKPDNSAMGVSVPVQVSETTVGRASGTSFSCPVLSGISACVIQAVPEAKYDQIISAMHQAGHLSTSPDSLYGYGIPDMNKVIKLLQDQLVKVPDKVTVVWPNPFTDNLEVTFKEAPQSLTVEIFNTTGRLISSINYTEYISRRLTISDLAGREQGMYIIRLTMGDQTDTHKVIKLRN